MARLEPNKARLMIGAALAALLPAQAAWGQTNLATGPAELEEVVVEAQRRSERLVDVPSSVVAVSEQAIAASGARNLAEVTRLAPNVNISNSGGLNGSIAIRGVGSASRNIGFDTRVGVYVDGVYLGQSPALNQELLDLERVEILRGPQGALFGKNTVAGAINLITAKPTYSFGGKASAEVSNLNGRFLSGDVNLPVGDSAAIKASASYRTRDGYVRNLFPGLSDGKHAGGAVDNFAWRVQGRWEPTEAVELLASVDGLRARGYVAVAEPITNTTGTARDSQAPGDRTTNYNLPNSDFRDLFGASLRATYDFGEGRPALVSITSWRDTKLSTAFDVDYSPTDIANVDYHDSYRQFTEELQLVSPSGERLEYLVGAYYYWQKGRTNRTILGGVDAGGFAGIQPGARLPSIGEVETENIALFANVTYDILPQLEAGVGFRLSHEKKAADWSLSGSNIPSLGLATGRLRRSRVDEDFSPTATLTYKITPDVSAYVRYSAGYKSGGFNLEYVSTAAFPGNLEFDKESVENYEAGVKGVLFDGRFRFSSAIFQADYTDYQVSQFRDLGGGRSGFVIGNAADVRTKGVEIEASLIPTDGLTLTVGLAALDARFSSFPHGGRGGADVSGNRLPAAPKFSGAFSADYVKPLAGTPLDLRTSLFVTHTGTQFTTADNLTSRAVGAGSVPWGFLQDYTLVDARLGIEHQTQGWGVSIFARNLFDAEPVVGYGEDFFGTLTRTLGPPRLYGVEAKARF